MKPYYQDASTTLYHCHYRAVLDALAMADCAVVDPPYGQTSLDWDVWPLGWPKDIASRCRSMWAFGTLRMFMDRALEFSDWKLSQDVVWEKQNGSSFHADRFRRIHESAAHFYKGAWDEVYKSPVMTLDATARVTRRKARPNHMGSIAGSSYVSHDGGPRLMRSIIYEPNCHGFAENETQKPLGILRPLIEYACPLGGLILDPFCGAGSVLVAAKEMGRSAIGIDIREDQCEAAARRLSQEVMVLA